MNSRARVEAVLSGQAPDRTPVGFFAIDSDIAEKVLGRPTYWRAKAKSQIAFWQSRRDEVVQSWIEDGIELYKKLDFIDIIPVCCSAAGLCPAKNYQPDPPEQIDETTWKDKNGQVYRYSPATKDISVIENPNTWTMEFDADKIIEQLKPSEPDDSIFEVVDAFLAAFGSDRFVLGPSADEMGWYLVGGYERGFLELATRPEQVQRVYDAMVQKACEEDKFYVRENQAGVLWGADYSDNKGPMISPEMFKDVFFAGNKKRISSIKSLGQRVMKHMCGNNWKLLDIMAEIGIDCYQSVQGSAGMDILEVYDKYSDKFAVWGGTQVENLIDGDEQSVRNDVKRVMSKLHNRPKYIFGTSHSVAVGTKYDNFMAMLDEFHKFCC